MYQWEGPNQEHSTRGVEVSDMRDRGSRCQSLSTPLSIITFQIESFFPSDSREHRNLNRLSIRSPTSTTQSNSGRRQPPPPPPPTHTHNRPVNHRIKQPTVNLRNAQDHAVVNGRQRWGENQDESTWRQ